MKKFLGFILTVFLAYIVSYYTVGRQKGYEIFDFNIAQILDEIDQDEDMETAAEYYNTAMDYYYAGDYNNAISYFDNSLYYNPENYDVIFFIGKSYYLLDEYADAIYHFNDLLADVPDYDSAYYFRGLSEYFDAQYDAAINDLYLFVNYNPNDYISYYYLARSYYEQNADNLAVALEMINEAIKKKPDYAAAYSYKGYLNMNSSNYQQGIIDTRMALLYDDNNQYAYYNLGWAYAKIDNTDSALYFYTECINKYPDYSAPYNSLGLIYSEMGNTDKAIEMFNKSIELEPENIYAYNNLGDIYRNKGEYQNALREYRRVFAYGASNEWAMYYEAYCFDKLGDTQNAIRTYENYLDKADQSDVNYQAAQDRINELK